jgi:DNA-binding MarR family transcriptional regulator
MSIRNEASDLVLRLEASGIEVDSNAVALCHSISRLSVVLQTLYEKAYAPIGVHPSGVEVLLSLHLQNDPRGETLANLAKRQNITPASLTNRMDQLVAKQLVERITSKDDKRITYARLTKAGKEAAATALPLKLGVESNLLKGLKKGDRKDFVKMLLKIADSVEAKEGIQTES